MTLETLAAEAAPKSAQTAAPAARKYSYSKKRLDAFDKWQEHVRQSAGDLSRSLFESPDRVA
jgi:hypothetical protein